MIFCYGVALAFLAAGCAVLARNLMVLTKSLRAPKKTAKIVGYTKAGIRWGMYIFRYQVLFSPGNVVQMERKVLPLGGVLPFYSMRRYLGRTVEVSYDPKHHRLFPHEVISIVYCLLSAILMLAGVGLFAAFGELFG